MKKLYRFFSSIRLTIILTYIIVSVAMTGSFALLFKSAPFESIDGHVLIDWIRKSSLSASWWIIVLVVLIFIFSLNTLFCTYDRVASLVRAWRGKKAAHDEDEETFVTEDIDRGKGIRLRTLLPYIAHLGFMIALAGHLAGSLWGFRGGDMMIEEGETVAVKGGKDLALKAGPMRLVIGKRGYPEEMSAEVSLLVDGKEVGKKKAEINHPLLYGDIAVYIKSVRQVPKGLVIRSSGRDEQGIFTLNEGDKKYLKGAGIEIIAGRVDRKFGAMEVIIFDGKKIIARKWLSPYNKQIRSIEFGDYRLTAEDLSLANTGTFTVNKDPGAWIVFTGLSLFIIPLTAHLFLRRRK